MIKRFNQSNEIPNILFDEMELKRSLTSTLFEGVSK